MQTEATKEHRWLAKFAGEWIFEGSCRMGPDQPPMKSSGRESARMVGDLWLVGEGSGEMPGGGTMTSVMTLGFDPVKGKFVGSWIGSPMACMFVYEGELDADGKTLPLMCEGPSFEDPTKTARYKDVVVLHEDGTRELRSHLQGEGGEWVHFMTATYRRTDR